jgi:hypothetical protein
MSDQELFDAIRKGKGKMPPEDEGRAKNDDVRYLVAYIRRMAREQAAAPAAQQPAATPAPSAAPAPTATPVPATEPPPVSAPAPNVTPAPTTTPAPPTTPAPGK